MRKSFVLVSIALFTATQVLAQNFQPGARPAPQMPQKPGLTGKARGKFIIRQLDLTPEQLQNAEALVEEHYKSATDNPDEILSRVRALTEELRKAEETKNQAEKDRISEELRKIGRGETDEGQFLANLRLILNDGQKAKLESTLERLKTNPSGEIRPIDVYRLVTGMVLPPADMKKIEAATAAFREQSSTAAPVRDPAALEAQHTELLNAYVKALTEALPADKRDGFTRQVNAIRAK